MSMQETAMLAGDTYDKEDNASLLFEELQPPSDWYITRLGDLFEENKLLAKNGFAYGGFNQNGQGIPHLRPFNVTEDGIISLSQIKYIDAVTKDSPYWMQQGDVIFNNTNSEDLVGKTAYFAISGKFVLSNHMTILRVLDDRYIDSLWLAMKFQHLWRLGVFKAMCRRHVGQASISIERLKRIQITLPPFPEQHAIAHILQTVQNAIQARRKELELERECKAALMQHLFTHGTRGELTKQTEIGEMPESWKVVELDSIVNIIYGIQAAVAHLRDKSIGIPILTNINIKNEGKLDIATLRYYNLSPDKREKLLLKHGDLLFNWRSGSQDHVGKTALFDLDGDYTFSSFILRLRPKIRINNFFLLYYLHCIKERGFFSQQRQQSSINSVFNASIAAKIPTAVAPIQEQQEIAAVLQACDSTIAALEKEIALQEELFRALLDELMTGRLSSLPLVE